MASRLMSGGEAMYCRRWALANSLLWTVRYCDDGLDGCRMEKRVRVHVTVTRLRGHAHARRLPASTCIFVIVV